MYMFSRTDGAVMVPWLKDRRHIVLPQLVPLTPQSIFAIEFAVGGRFTPLFLLVGGSCFDRSGRKGDLAGLLPLSPVGDFRNRFRKEHVQKQWIWKVILKNDSCILILGGALCTPGGLRTMLHDIKRCVTYQAPPASLVDPWINSHLTYDYSLRRILHRVIWFKLLEEWNKSAREGYAHYT